MSNIDDEVMLSAEEDARELEFIKGYLPQELQEKFSDDDLYYMIDVIADCYAETDILNLMPDKDGYVDVDLERVVDYVVKKAKKEKIGDFDPEDVLFVVQADWEFGEEDEEDE